MGGHREAEVLGGDEHFAERELEPDLVGNLVGADGDTLDNAQQVGAADHELVVVVLGDHAAVGRVVAFDETAYQDVAAEAEIGVLVVVADGDVLVELGQDALEDRGGFLVEDEIGFLRKLGADKTVADELVGVGSDQRGDFGINVEEDSVHHGTELLFCRGVDGVVDAVEQDGGGDDDAFGNLADHRQLGEISRIEAGNLGSAAGPDDIHHRTALIHAERKGLVGELLEGIGQELGRHGRGTFLGDLGDGERGLERCLSVGGGHGQCVALQLEKEVLQDGVGGFGNDDLGNGHQAIEQFGAGNGKFHIWYNFYISISRSYELQI